MAVRALNDNTEIVGFMADAIEHHAPYIWRNGVYTTLSHNGENTSPSDINNKSQITGSMVVRSGDSVDYYPVFWTSATSYSLLSMPPQFNYGIPEAINENGVIVGHFSVSYDSLRAFTYENGALTILPIQDGFDPSRSNCRLFDINNSGKAIGYSEGYIGPDLIRNAFVLSNGVITNLGDYLVYEINNQDQIAGRTAGAPVRAVKFTNNIPYLYENGPFTFTQATAINDSSVMVGTGGTLNGNKAVKFVDTQIIDLNTLIDANSGIVLTDANFINNKDEILAKGYYPPNTVPIYYFLLRPHGNDILYPALNDLFVAGQTDTIRWDAGPGGRRSIWNTRLTEVRAIVSLILKRLLLKTASMNGLCPIR